jgi:hypothetical protein
LTCEVVAAGVELRVELPLVHHGGMVQNIQGTFREHSGNIPGTFREHSRNIQGTFNRPVRLLQLEWSHGWSDHWFAAEEWFRI